MQSSNHDPNRPPAKQESTQDTELNDTWRALLGQMPAPTEPEIGDLLAEEQPAPIQPLAGDPWSHLIQSQGMQAVDLQKVRLHDLYPAAGDEDVEHALNLMRESTGQLRALDKQAKEE